MLVTNLDWVVVGGWDQQNKISMADHRPFALSVQMRKTAHVTKPG